MTLATSIAAIRKMVQKSILAKPIDKMVGHPSTTSHKNLVNQLAQAAGDIESKEWGGNHGTIALVLEDEPYQTLTGDPNLLTAWQDMPNAVHPDIDARTSKFELLTLQEDQKLIITEYQQQVAVNNTLKECLIKAVDEQYIEELKKDYIGYANETTKTILAHIKTTWCKVTTHEKRKAKAHI